MTGARVGLERARGRNTKSAPAFALISVPCSHACSTVHDLHSDAGLTVVMLATGSHVDTPATPVRDQDPAAVDFARGLHCRNEKLNCFFRPLRLSEIVLKKYKKMIFFMKNVLF